MTELADFERAGLQIVFVPEAYSFDAVSQLGFIAARTDDARDRLRHPADLLENPGADRDDRGRARLRLRRPVHPRPRHVSGPQVIEGWHGVPYDAPVGRTRELVEICRLVWRRDRLDYQGKHYTLPLERRHRPRQAAQADQPPGPRRASRSSSPPSARRTSTLAAELAEGWQPIFYLPEKAGLAWDEPLDAGKAKRDAGLGAARRDRRRPARHRRRRHRSCATSPARSSRSTSAAWAPAARNFYYDLACRFGYEREASQIQDHYLAGRKDEAAALVPAELVEKTALIGPHGYVAERLAAFRESGVTTLNVTPLAPTHQARVKDIETIRTLAGDNTLRATPP